ncbi:MULTISPECIES: type II toxin-antitoxin system VapC family toxin [Rhizobium/Agrobacterium group]|uniref:type II toxin-antitoxin system VapC family toxin n=1 Tax=Rhizobium/Agrobacterium group TaxID=227290 RepID=UPI0022C54BEB|nr:MULTISPECIES: type II toxin-antitoxin system VapC family toxin [Rhizobium/Agrobacterium group]MCZ7485834.1 type II toxin-antitoxin system VapC family toxin [Rhizobium rhizogenes]MDO3442132.1 type II toxin-antitoxin system VapC family toxin [Agrobacterium sp. V1]
MIVIDTSALMAILFDESTADACAAALETDEPLLISAGTLAEALIVAQRRGRSRELEMLIEGLGVEIRNVTPKSTHGISEAYRIWGKGIHPAGLNFGDCFAYELAKTEDCPLLYVGNDFSQTDISGVL